MSEPKEPKVTVDFGLSAKASLEAKVSTEIPAQSTGKLLDALTDVIRPFSERRGLKADQIRLQREEVLIEIARKAHHRLEIDNPPINPLPNKFLVPFLEKASLEELDSVLIDRWADLLASCSADPQSAHPRFVQILSELGADDAQLLNRITLNNLEEHRIDKAIDMIHWMYAPNVTMNALELFWPMEHDLGVIATIFQNLALDLFSRPGVSLTHMSLLGARDKRILAFDTPDLSKCPAILTNNLHRRSLDILISLHLLAEYNLTVPNESFVSVQISYVCLTSLAADFLIRCDRDLQRRLQGSQG